MIIKAIEVVYNPEWQKDPDPMSVVPTVGVKVKTDLGYFGDYVECVNKDGTHFSVSETIFAINLLLKNSLECANAFADGQKQNVSEHEKE